VTGVQTCALPIYLDTWTREVAEVRVHGTTDEAPIVRFARDETQALQPIDGRPPFEQIRELIRRVQADCCVEVDRNAYSVPWRLIGENVRVEISAGRLRVLHAGGEVAVHDERIGRRQRAIDPGHFAGVAGFDGRRIVPQADGAAPAVVPALLRPLAEYEAVVGGGW
jgi:hypothetical protein